MCGFINFFKPVADPLGPDLTQGLEGGWGRLQHRGPDDGHLEQGPGWWMGFRRLSILDVTDHGRQPMHFAPTHTLTFNGEIYNFRELRARHALSHLASSGDTVVLGSLLQRRRPEEVVEQLRGMFAFCWWNAESRRLVAARDQFGIKPLYYLEHPEGLALASELTALLPLLPDRNAIRPAALAEYFRWGAVQGPGTIMSSIRQLLPGELLFWDAGKLRIERYYLPRWGAEPLLTDLKVAAQRTREVVCESVRSHLVSDVPVGVFLSGGLDSNIVVAGMRAAGAEKIAAFSIGYGSGSGVPCESDAARRSAEFFGADFHAEQITARTLDAHFDHYIRHLDQPSGDAFNTYLVSRLAAKSVKVALSGLGADEWFGGYNYLRFLQVLMRLPGWSKIPREAAAPWAARLYRRMPKAVQGRPSVKAIAYAAGAFGVQLFDLHANSRSIEEPDAVARLLQTHEARSSLPLRPPNWPARGGQEWLHQLYVLETESYLQNTLLRDNDAMSMAHSLELRVPLVDVEVQRLSASLHPSLMLTARQGKVVLREAFRELLPPWIAADQQKKTFTLPLMKWLREPCWRARIRDTLGSAACRTRGWLDPSEIERSLDAYFRSGAESRAAWRLSQKVWQLFILESWARSHLDAPTRSRPP